MSVELNNLSPLAKGGQSFVYQVTHEGDEVALKASIPQRPASVKALRQEVSLLTQLEPHPNIVSVIDTGCTATSEFYIMELYKTSLKQFLGLAFRQRLPWQEMILKLCDALESLHSQGILHLDINPSNIMLRSNMDPVLIDFGLSRRLGSSAPSISQIPEGTFYYMPPEIWRSLNPTAATDIYSLGMTVFHFLNGRLPYVTTNTSRLLDSHLSIPHPLLASSDQFSGLNYWFSKTLAPNPTNRFFSVKETRDELNQAFSLM